MSFLRVLVLWLAMAGAMAASRFDRHLAIDVLSKSLPIRPRLLVRAIVNAATAALCVVLCWHAYRFVAEAREFEDVILNDLPAWWFQGHPADRFRPDRSAIHTIRAPASAGFRSRSA